MRSVIWQSPGHHDHGWVTAALTRPQKWPMLAAVRKDSACMQRMPKKVPSVKWPPGSLTGITGRYDSVISSTMIRLTACQRAARHSADLSLILSVPASRLHYRLIDVHFPVPSSTAIRRTHQAEQPKLGDKGSYRCKMQLFSIHSKPTRQQRE